MRKSKQKVHGSDVYALIRDSRMSEVERRAAIHAMRNAEAIVDMILWAKGKLAALGSHFLKPSLKH